MPYTLITPTGKIYTFYILAVAETFLSAYGGVIIDPVVLKVIPENALLYAK